MADTTLGIIGFGNMGEALGAGWSRAFPGRPWLALEKVPAAAARVQAAGGVLSADLDDLTGRADLLVVAVKPQDMAAFCAQLKPLLKPAHTVISLAAGLSLKYFEERLGHAQLARFMPNLAAKVGRCLVGVSFGPGLTEDRIDRVKDVAQALGGPLVVPEKLLAAVTGVSGSGLAFVFEFLDGLAMGGVREGLPYAQALDLALATVEGACALMRQTPDHPRAWVTRVTSPAGTTIEGMRVLAREGLAAAAAEAVSAASRRAQELEG